MNEWGFGGEIKSWWDDEFRQHRQDWAIDRCELEKTEEGGRKRSDLAVLRGGVTLVSGELRLPDHEVPWPSHPDNLADAIGKAMNAQARWAFTSDSVSLLLIDCEKTGLPAARVVHRLQLADFSSRSELDNPATLQAVEEAWRGAIAALVPIMLGLVSPPALNADDLFVDSLRALLSRPVSAIRTALANKSADDAAFRESLVRWIVDDQNWPHSDETFDHEIARAAQLTAYVFAVRLMFYEALRRAEPTLNVITIAATADPEVAAQLVKVFFDNAMVKSGDYATLFQWDKVSDFAFSSREAVESWTRVLAYLGQIQLNELGYDVLGRLFERLIDPEERYHWGQYYTSPAVVDLMLSFAMSDGTGSVLDPACGGGTFLVRAYARAKAYDGTSQHQELLTRLFGIDVSPFPATIATVNLASRSLTFDDNYPRVIARTLFALEPSLTDPLLRLPAPHSTNLDGETVPVLLDTVEAVVCNPPYVRLKDLGAARKAGASLALRRPQRRIPVPSALTGSANYHLYFWFHASQFLAPSGCLAFITASEWMDSDYGGQLQIWLLNNFKIRVVIRSLAETWFEDARVGTVVLVAERCADGEARENNLVRFITLRRSLEDLYGRIVVPDTERIAAVDRLRDRLLAVSTEVGEGDDFDWSVVSQRDLRALGGR